ncbi:MAG: ribbon-helix-helix protein, CopG family [Desulfobacteraceae bacterium]|nr:ribbon-helix-helix protein, CopG family [Desulfobacteraceae bacterium]
MTTQMIIRLDDELKEKVNKLAKAEGKNASIVVRELLEGYVKDRDISAYIDDLWRRAGGRLKAKGVNPEDIARAIREARAKK